MSGFLFYYFSGTGSYFAGYGGTTSYFAGTSLFSTFSSIPEATLTSAVSLTILLDSPSTFLGYSFS